MHNQKISNEQLWRQIENDMRRWKEANAVAEEIVRDRGWNEADEDFWFQVEDEAKRQWGEEMEREMMEEMLEEQMRVLHKQHLQNNKNKM